MEYFKVIEEGTTTSIEVNRIDNGDFVFQLSNKESKRMLIILSAIEAKDLSDFIIKRLSEEKPQECNSPF